MHFAAGMAGAAVIGAGVCLLRRGGWRWLPLAMTAGGAWAITPDLPRVFREDFPSLPFAATLGSKDLEHWLHSIGDVFFFHARLDAQPHEFALHGLAAILVLYNLSIALLMWMERRQRRAAVRARAAAASHALAADSLLHRRMTGPAAPPPRTGPRPATAAPSAPG